MEIEDASDLIFQEALRRLGPCRKLDTEVLHRKMAEVLQEQGETIFAQLSNEARERLQRHGLRIEEQTARLERINEAIQYGRWLIARYNAETLGHHGIRRFQDVRICAVKAFPGSLLGLQS